jgi:hypothetical protein
MTSRSMLDALANNRSHVTKSNFLGYLLPNLKDLTISLRIPLRFYQTLGGIFDDTGLTCTW